MVRKRTGVYGRNAELVEDGKLYVKKSVIKENKDHWTYRQMAILRKTKGHQNILELYALVIPEKEGAMPDMLFEYVEHTDGLDLSNPFKPMGIDKLINKTNMFDHLSSIRNFMHQLLSALDKFHSTGAMHRDIKPGNLLLTKDGVLKVLDFDLAEFLDERYDLKFGIATKGYKAPESFLK